VQEIKAQDDDCAISYQELMMSEYSNNIGDKTEGSSNQNIVFIVGAFPPPVHGMAAVNAAVRARLIEAGAVLSVINVAAKNLERSLVVRLWRVQRVARGLSRLLFGARLREATLYMSVSGGVGQAYEILFLILARLRRMRIYLHHHSFAYLDRTSWLTYVLTLVAGSDSVHITLSSGMAVRLKSQYCSVCHVLPISNAVFFPGHRSSSVILHTSLKTIGFISNISEEKGIFDFLDLVEAYEAEGLLIKAKIAGPCQDEKTEYKLKKRIGKLNTVEYIGPQYGDDKEIFFNEIDVLIFPTQYVNEAEPLIIHEAMQYAIPVIAYGRGCIPEIVSPECGRVIEPALPFMPAALTQLKQWLTSPNVYRMASNSAVEHFAIALENNSRRWNELLKEMLGDDASDDSGTGSLLEDLPSRT